MRFPSFRWGRTPAAHFCDGGTEKQVNNFLRHHNVHLCEVVGPASTFRGMELYWKLYYTFPRCLATLELMASKKGLL